jgi:methylenetetrahydrofolate dehydrogenase (NADP+)/methenyltetrahydrofolate cyclohydrolase
MTAFSSNRRCRRSGPDAERQVADAVSIEKDVDGFHPVNVGRLVQGRPALVACTPAGIIELLDRSRNSDRRTACRRHRSKRHRRQADSPAAAAPARDGHDLPLATVDLPSVARQADILVSAIGRPAFVTPDFVKPGATVVDVGTTRVEDRGLVEALFPPDSRRRQAFERRGALTLGDVHPAVQQVAGALTPVPGGVGPLTIAMLLRNTVTAAERRARRRLVGQGSPLCSESP